MKKFLKIIGIVVGVMGMILFFSPASFHKCYNTTPLTSTGCINSCIGFSTADTCYGIVTYDANNQSSAFEKKIDFWTGGQPKFFCSGAGELIHHTDGANRCCAGLSGFSVGCPENDCNCEHSQPNIGGLVKCSDCGNGICERDHFENHCNCSKDCGI